LQQAVCKVVRYGAFGGSFIGLSDAGLMTFFDRAVDAFVSRIKLLNTIVCDGIFLFFNFESFVFGFGGIFRNQVVMDQTTRTRPFLEPVAVRHFSHPWSGTSTEYKSESRLITYAFQHHTADESSGRRKYHANRMGSPSARKRT